MWSVFISAAFICCGPAADATTPPPPPEVVAELSRDLLTGSLIFSRGDCLAVKIFSQSSYTHVGAVVVKGGGVVVYDSMNGHGVRKTPLTEYLRQQTPSEVHFIHPKEAFSAKSAVAFERHLESQLGRKYAVKHHLTGQRCDGLHCSEYVTDALIAADTITAIHPPKVSPGSLLEGVMSGDLYTNGNRYDLKVVDPPQPINRPWYARAWYDTQTCCSKSATQMRRWILCR